MKSRFFIIALALVSLFVGCDSASRLVVDAETNGRVYGSVIVEADTSTIHIIDYLSAVEEVDSITCKSVDIQYANDGVFTMIVNAQSPSLGNIELWRGGVATSLVYQRKDFITTTLKLYSIAATDKYLSVGFTAQPDKVIAYWQNTILPQSFIEIQPQSIKITLPSGLSDVDRSYIRVYASKADSIFSDVLTPLANGKVVESVEELTRKDAHKQIIYSLMIDRFNNGNKANDMPLNSDEVLDIVDYMGGDIKGITQKIESGFFTDLGISTIWLSPITQNPYDAWGLYENPRTKFSGYHGYWPIYTTVIDKRFGTEEELRELLAKAHEKDINVILDYVANHLHIDSPVLQENPDWTTPMILPDGRENIELWDEHRLTTWFDKHIPTLDLERLDICEPMTDSALFWVANFDFDGFRHDATKHVPRQYWRMLTRKMNERFPDRQFYQIGETYGSPELINSYVKSGMLDGQFDFNVYDRATWSIGTEEGSLEELSNEISKSLVTYGSHNLMGYITGNHDRPRFISLAGGSLDWGEDTKAAGWLRDVTVGDSTSYNRLQLLNAMLLTIPGVPCIYQGDEYGVPGGNDPDNRHMMQFDGYNKREAENLAVVTKLAQLRQSSLPLIYGDYIPLRVEKDFMIFARVYLGEVMIVAINKSIEAENITFTTPEIEGKNYTLLMSHFDTNAPNSKVVDRKAEITLKPLSFDIYTME